MDCNLWPFYPSCSVPSVPFHSGLYCYFSCLGLRYMKYDWWLIWANLGLSLHYGNAFHCQVMCRFWGTKVILSWQMNYRASGGLGLYSAILFTKLSSISWQRKSLWEILIVGVKLLYPVTGRLRVWFSDYCHWHCSLNFIFGSCEPCCVSWHPCTGWIIALLPFWYISARHVTVCGIVYCTILQYWHHHY